MTAVGFEGCFRQHMASLVALATSMSGDAELGRDIAQEAFLRLHRQWDQLVDHDNLGGWLTTVVANLTIDHHRARVTHGRVLGRLNNRPKTDVVDEPTVDRWDELIRPLPPRQKVIVTLHYGEDLGIAEIASMLGVSVNTVKSALSKARDTLRQIGDRDEC